MDIYYFPMWLPVENENKPVVADAELKVNNTETTILNKLWR